MTADSEYRLHAPQITMRSMSLVPGQVVRARVAHVAVFGLFMNFRGHDILVLIPETSWTACYASCAEIADVGDEFDVSILKWVEERNQYTGSIRAVHPESDPWSGGWSLHVGDRLRATVVRSVDRADRCGDRPGYLLQLRPAAYVMVCEGSRGEWPVGRECEVTVTVVNVHRREIHVGRRTERGNGLPA